MNRVLYTVQCEYYSTTKHTSPCGLFRSQGQVSRGGSTNSCSQSLCSLILWGCILRQCIWNKMVCISIVFATLNKALKSTVSFQNICLHNTQGRKDDTVYKAMSLSPILLPLNFKAKLPMTSMATEAIFFSACFLICILGKVFTSEKWCKATYSLILHSIFLRWPVAPKWKVLFITYWLPIILLLCTAS